MSPSALLNMTFDYVSDSRVRELLLKLEDEATKSLEVGAYLGTIVACGGAAEGLLTWVLSIDREVAEQSKKAQKDRQGNAIPLENWNLTYLIQVAIECNLLGDVAANACWSLKEFRNFIHPYRLLHQSLRPDENLALNAVTALREISRSIEGRRRNRED
jgi:hypothetical protein